MILMGTLGGFPNPPALWLRPAKPTSAYAIMGTLGGFPNPPALGFAQQFALAQQFGWLPNNSRQFLLVSVTLRQASQK